MKDPTRNRTCYGGYAEYRPTGRTETKPSTRKARGIPLDAALISNEVSNFDVFPPSHELFILLYKAGTESSK